MIASLLLAASVLLQTSEITEPNTKVTFSTHLQTAAGEQALGGTGVRTRTMLKVKVYAFGLYLDAAGARSALAAWRKSTCSMNVPGQPGPDTGGCAH